MRGKWINIFLSGILAAGLLLTPVSAHGETQGAGGESTAAQEQDNAAGQESTSGQNDAPDSAGTAAHDDTLITSPSGVLMEAQTGTIIYEKDKDTRRSPASITKIMTLILIFDAIENGALKMEDTVTTSAYAKSMGGSQVFLEEGETQNVETMIKCIVIASGNDASVAMAEHIAGSEQEFVKRMNERAAGLGMVNTHFEDCCGLTESTNHYTSAHDIAIMSRELITRYPKILEYSSIWMENITHVTRQGTSEFGLTNTNKLVRSYEGCVGLKTGSTSIAKFCLSAVAQRNGITLIAVVMAAPEVKTRFKDAAALLNYGFSKCSLYVDEKMSKLPLIPVKKGVEDEVPLAYEQQFKYLNTDGKAITEVKKKLKIPRTVDAPVKKGTPAGEMLYYMDGKELGSVRVLYAKSVKKATYADCLRTIFREVFS